MNEIHCKMAKKYTFRNLLLHIWLICHYISGENENNASSAQLGLEVGAWAELGNTFPGIQAEELEI